MVRNDGFDANFGANVAVRGATVRHLRSLIAAVLLLAPAAVGAQAQGEAGAAATSYDLGRVSQFDPTTAADTIPNDPKARRHNAEVAATEETIYGLPAVLQYAEMYAQAVDRGSKRYVGFNRFVHDRDLADPDMRRSRAPIPTRSIPTPGST